MFVIVRRYNGTEGFLRKQFATREEAQKYIDSDAGIQEDRENFCSFMIKEEKELEK